MRLGIGLDIGGRAPPSIDHCHFSASLKKTMAAFALKNTSHITSFGATLKKTTAAFDVAA